MYKDIDKVIEDNSMEYSAYILTNRAIPDLRDSCKPVVKRIIYTMYREKATKFTKSATMSGKVMAIHPHSDCYPTMVRMVQTDNQLLPWLEGKGNFSQHTSRDLMYASSRYTEVKLSPFTIDVLKGLNDKSVKFVPNYDGTIMIPEVLPVKFPMILNYCQSGIGMGMASSIPSFNMIEIAKAIELYIKKGIKTDLIPDFATSGLIIDNKENIKRINNYGLGNVILRGKTEIKDNIITITEIPYTTTREVIIDKVINLIKTNKFKEITKVNDLTGLHGMCIEITCKKNVNMNLVVEKLYKNTPLEFSFSANMNVLSKGLPKVMGTWQIIDEWLEWRKECVISTYEEDIKNLSKQLHLYEGLIKIINYIDDIIEIIKKAKDDDEMIQKLVKKFNISKEQAEYISEIKIKNLNKSHINKIIKDKKELEDSLENLKDILNNPSKILNIISDEINIIANTYGQPRRTKIISETNIIDIPNNSLTEEFSCQIVLTQQGYIKKNRKYSENQKLKDGDSVLSITQVNNKDILIFLTSEGRAINKPCDSLTCHQPSELGLYQKNTFDLNDGEIILKVLSSNENKDVFILTAEGKALILNAKDFISSNRTKQYIKLQSDKFADNKVIGIIDATEELSNILIQTEKKSSIDINLLNNGLEYYKGKLNNTGNFIYNCRNKKDRVIQLLTKL